MTDKIIDKMTKVLDKRISSESSRIRKDIDDKLRDLRKEFDIEISQLNKKLNEREPSANRIVEETHDLSLNIVIRGLPETVNENVAEKVDALIKDGLKVKTVTVASAIRKISRVEYKAGLVIATLRSNSDKKR